MAVILLLALAACDEGPKGTDPEDTAADSGGGDSGEPHVPDADGDGHLSYEDGGDDCDDENAGAYPGAAEACDAVDQDCDGAPLTPGICGEVQDPASGTRWLVHGEDSMSNVAVGVTSDVTEDGVGDVLLGVFPQGGYGIFPGGSWPARPYSTPDDAWMRIQSGGLLTGGVALDAGDVNGDGAGDLGVVSHDYTQLWYFFGPFAEGADLDLFEDADLRYEGDGESWGYFAVGNLDFDGDGLADAMSPSAGSGGGATARLNVFFGMDPERCDVGTAGAGRAYPIGDPTGDGLDDLALVDASLLYLLDGSLLREACSSADAAAFSFAWSQAMEGDASTYLHHPWNEIGDWSGDGLDDLVVSHPDSGTEGTFGEILFFDGATRGVFSDDDSVGSYAGVEEGDYALGDWYLHSSDFDGDGVRDLFTVGTVEGGFGQFVIRGGQIPPPHTPVPERALRFADNEAEAMSVNYRMPPGDVDGDGYADLFTWRVGGGTYEVGALPGFAVPWDDDQYW